MALEEHAITLYPTCGKKTNGVTPLLVVMPQPDVPQITTLTENALTVIPSGTDSSSTVPPMGFLQIITPPVDTILVVAEGEPILLLRPVQQQPQQLQKKSGRSNPTKWTYEMVRDFINETGDTLISIVYVRMKDYLEILCYRCGNIYKMTFDSFKSGRRHLDCSGKKKHTIEYVREFVKANGDILLSIVYINNKTPLDIQCGKCQSLCHPTFAHYQGRRGNGCKPCANEKLSEERRFPIEYVRGYIESRGEKMVSTTYRNCEEKIDVECHECFKVYAITFGHYKQGVRCADCIMSKGERRIILYLNSKGIAFLRDKRYDDCRDTKTLSFDFRIPDVDTLIEYDGTHHFQPVEQFGGKPYFEITQLHDRIKTNYAINNKIKLIRIDYKSYNKIEALLDEYLTSPGMLCLSNPTIYEYLKA